MQNWRRADMELAGQLGPQAGQGRALELRHDIVQRTHGWRCLWQPDLLRRPLRWCQCRRFSLVNSHPALMLRHHTILWHLCILSCLPLLGGHTLEKTRTGCLDSAVVHFDVCCLLSLLQGVFGVEGCIN